MPFGPSRRERQDGIQPVQRLDRRLLVRRKHGGVTGRIEVQPDHIGRLCLEVRVVREHVPLEPMRLEPGAAPDPRDQRMTDPEHLGQLPGTPVRTAVGRALPRLRENARLEGGRPDGRRLAPIPGLQTGQTLRLEPLPPAVDVVGVAPHGRGDGRERLAGREHQDHLGAPGIFRPDLSAASPSLQLRLFLGRQGQRHTAQYTTTHSVETVH